MLIVEKHNRAAGLEVEGAGSVQDGVLDNLDDAFFRDGSFGLDLHDGAAECGGVEESLGSAFGHDGGRRGGRRREGLCFVGEEVGEDVDEFGGGSGEAGKGWHPTVSETFAFGRALLTLLMLRTPAEKARLLLKKKPLDLMVVDEREE